MDLILNQSLWNDRPSAMDQSIGLQTFLAFSKTQKVVGDYS